jgi:hypothetical protein
MGCTSSISSFFEEFGGEVLGEGDSNGHDGISADLTCSCGEVEGNHLKRELAEYTALYYSLYARPPWHPKEISPDEVRARETFNRLSSREAEHPDDRPEVVRKYKERPFDTSNFNLKQWGIDIGFYVGQMQVGKQDEDWRIAPEEIPIFAYTMEICFEDQTLSLGWINFDTFIYGFSSLLHYLAKHGCTNFRYEFVDFGQVRGD